MFPHHDDIQACIETLHQGGLLLYPTDTVWGIGCDATNERAIQCIFELKKRVDTKAMIVLVENEAAILKYVDVNELQIFDYIKGIHKPTTVIYQRAKNLASNLLASDGSVAIRICKDSFCQALIQQFGKPIGGFQLTQKKLAEMITEITKAQLLCWRLGVLKNENRATPAQISMAKRNNVNMALQIAREARQIHGGMGITGEYPIMRHMMNLESVVTYEGTHDIHLLITGMDITGLNAFS